MRARYPDVEGVVVRDGVRVGYDVYGEPGRPTLVLLTSWAIVHARQWKAQIPYLARHFRVIAVEGRGNGRADRPDDEAAYADDEYVADVLAVMDATDTDAPCSSGCRWGPGTRCSSPPATPIARRASSRWARCSRLRNLPTSRTSSPATRAGGSSTGTTGSPTTRASSSSSWRGLPGAALPQAPRGRRQLGAGHRRPDPRSHPQRPGAAHGRRRRGDLPRGALPRPGPARHRGHDRASGQPGRRSPAGPVGSW